MFEFKPMPHILKRDYSSMKSAHGHFESFLANQDKEGKEKKGDGGEENTDEEQGELSDESYSTDGDYNEEHFDDDEDDYNVEDDHNDEPMY
ncbi:hypothetical protein DITRI_Ditri08aG0106800 [Diplodiscus trichospermus]